MGMLGVKTVDLFDKCFAPSRTRQAEELGIYPYFVPIASDSGPEVTIDGRKVLMFGSNNYLGLTQDPRVREAAVRAIEDYGTSCTGSRLMNGTLDLHVELEERIARFAGKEAALVFTTGFQTNLGTISGIVGRGDVVVMDRANHASIVDGCRLSFGRTIKYGHNDMQDLERVLAAHAGRSGLFIVVDGVFSMEGDLANLPEIVRLKNRYGARLMVDDAHGIGVMAARGTAHYFGLTDDVDLVMGTFSKSFASTGGFVAGDKEIIYYIKHHARSFLFSASIPPAAAAAALCSLDILENEPEHMERLWANTALWRAGLDKAGFNLGASQSPIIPVIIGEDLRVGTMWRKLFDDGLFVNAAVAPAVQPGKGLLRTSCIASHQEEHLYRGLEILERAGRHLGVLGAHGN